jgi:histidinol-phosphatase
VAAVPDLADDLTLAHELADLADRITMDRFRASDLVVETKPDLTPVSEADRAVERAMRERLAEVRPADLVFGEEYGADSGDAARRWIVDPIDGTKSYVRGMPVWATLIALEDDGELICGIASAPALGVRWWAARGQGAYAREHGGDPRRLHVSGISEMADAQLCFGGLDDWSPDGRAALLELSARCWRSRGFGDFWQYMLVAEGAAEMGVDPVVSMWDIAAPLVIVTEAGGRFTDLAGVATAEGGAGVASNGHLHEAMLAALRP